MDLSKFRTLARNWDALGDADPLFGVLSEPSKHGGKWEIDEFFASGRAHVAKLMRSLEDARASFEHGSCLDFGCGVGRLTVPLSAHFARTVGVDVASSMIESARQFHRPSGRVEFVVNRDPDLRAFPSATFDVVHSCLVLQHIPPEVSLRYIAEFLRITRPGGLVVFQVPAETRTEQEISASHALPEGAHVARLTIANPPKALGSSERATIGIVVGNDSTVPWRHDIPAGRHICLANHWLRADGSMAIHDDGRARLPRTIDPGERVEIPLTVEAPSDTGSYVLEIDLVQEHVCWFASRGSQTARVPVQVVPLQVGPSFSSGGTASPVGPSFSSSGTASPVGPSFSSSGTASPVGPSFSSGVTRRVGPSFSSGVSLLRRLLRRVRGATPTFEMHVVPRAHVERVIDESGGTLLRAIDDNAAGPQWLSFTYICRKRS